MLQLSQFDYTLPEKAIAHSPVEPRDHSKLLVLNRQSGVITHSHYYDLWKFLRTGDVLVRNNSKVINARLRGIKETGGDVEILLNREIDNGENYVIWECLTKPGLKVGQSVQFEKDGTVLLARCEGMGTDGYTRKIKFFAESKTFFALLEKVGEIPLPPYIETMTSKKIAEQYQTTYAQQMGSVAAPTAGLHFTPELDRRLRDNGVIICEVTLHVGLGTFLPVKTENITSHVMHEELFSVSKETAEIINKAKVDNRRVIAVGTTTTRVLETLINQSRSKSLINTSGCTNIFIFPPKKFECVDALLTNFHLPKSTLLMLVSAFVSEPNTFHSFTSFNKSVVGKAYAEAVANEYRFFSFGDGMLIM